MNERRLLAMNTELQENVPSKDLIDGDVAERGHVYMTCTRVGKPK